MFARTGLESYKKPITMPAKYLEVFSVVYKDFFSDKSKKIKIDLCYGAKLF
jgi:hypothetical protein